MSVALHGLNNCQHFFVVDLVVLLRRLKLAAVKGDRMEYSIRGVALRDDGTECVVGSIRLEYRGERRIEMAKDRGSGESGSELLECSLGPGIPMELAPLLEQRRHG